MNSYTSKKIKFDYKWVILLLCFLAILAGLGIASGTRGLFLKAVTAANGFPRALYSLQDSIRYIITAVVNLFLGVLVLKLGIKKLLLIGSLALGGACTVFSFTHSLWGFYLGGVLFGIGFSVIGTGMVGLIVNRWFDGKHKGKIMGVILCSNGLGTAIASPIVGKIIAQDTFAYQRAYRMIVVLMVILFVLILLFFREYPKNYQIEAAPEKKPEKGKKTIGNGYHPAKTLLFWLTAAMVFFSGMILNGISGVSTAHLQDVQLPEDYVLLLVSVHAIALAGSKFITGAIYDRKGLKFSMLMCQTCGVIAMLALALTSPTKTGMVLAMIFEVVSSMALPIETVMVPLIAGELFDKKYYNQVLGYMVAANVLGFATGGPLLNLSSDRFGSYVPMFVTFAVVMAMQAVLLLVNLKLKKRADAAAQ